MKRWLAVIALSLSAAALNLSTLEYGKSVTTTYIGNRIVSTRPDTPILFVSDVADTFCPSGKPDEPCAFATQRGFFPRPGVPRLLALVAGAALPLLFLLAAVVYGVRRRWVTVACQLAAALVLFGLFVDVPVRYFEGPAGADIQHQISADAIWIGRIDAAKEDCSPAKWVRPVYCSKHEYAFVNGAFPTRGVPRLFAICAGMIAPTLLVMAAVFTVIRRRRQVAGR